MDSITNVPPSVPIIIKRIEELKVKELKAQTQVVKQMYEMVIYELQRVLDEVTGVCDDN